MVLGGKAAAGARGVDDVDRGVGVEDLRLTAVVEHGCGGSCPAVGVQPGVNGRGYGAESGGSKVSDVLVEEREQNVLLIGTRRVDLVPGGGAGRVGHIENRDLLVGGTSGRVGDVGNSVVEQLGDVWYGRRARRRCE